jgi:glycosyltransferase involved in cell wall biosynthesis
MGESPLVSVITPVYNGERYLTECIESVLNQTYQNWEYVLVNNASTDGTLDIIRRYAERDPRIRVHNNDHTVGVIQNHNIAFRLISARSKYCKLIQGDDWMFPLCLELMVHSAEAAPNAGVVGSYCLAGKQVRCDGLTYPSPLIPGPELARMTLLGLIYLFWSPSCLLIHSDLIRNRQPFYRSNYLHADVEALYDILQYHDFAFVHQILTYIRAHENSVTAQDAKRINSQRLSHLHLLRDFGPVYLDEYECSTRQTVLLNDYYNSLALGVFDFKQADFWQHQKSELRKLGFPLSYTRLLRAVATELFSNPRGAARRLKGKLNRAK